MLRELSRLDGHSAPVTDVAISPDGTQVVSRARDDTIRLWDVGTARELERISESNQIIALTFGSAGPRALIQRYNTHWHLRAFGPDEAEYDECQFDDWHRCWARSACTGGLGMLSDGDTLIYWCSNRSRGDEARRVSDEAIKCATKGFLTQFWLVDVSTRSVRSFRSPAQGGSILTCGAGRPVVVFQGDSGYSEFWRVGERPEIVIRYIMPKDVRMHGFVGLR